MMGRLNHDQEQLLYRAIKLRNRMI
jgi:hypothetical protein